MNKFAKVVMLVTGSLLLGGCSYLMGTGLAPRGGVSSSLVDYLYPDGQEPPAVYDTIPQLNVPLRVGVAFVPNRYGGSYLSEATKMTLLEDVRQAFAGREYIQRIEIVPETYMRSSTGVQGMQQVARLYGVDVMALVSYDQVSTLEDNSASFLYWTIVGAYFVKGTENETQTFVDTAVFDVKTARLLFRAPGINRERKHTTAVEVGETQRKVSEASFKAAVAHMNTNLASELERFRERIKEDPQVAEVTYAEGWGGGSVGWLWLLILIAGAAFPSVARTARSYRSFNL
jgi:rhombotail lipoprotein